MIGILLAIQVPGIPGAIFDHLETRYIAAMALFFMSTSLATNRLWQAFLKPGPVMFALALTWGAAPLLAWYVGPWVLPAKYQEGLIIAAAIPCTLASAAIWTGMGGGNEAIALLMTMITNSFVFIGTAGWLAYLTAQDVSFDVSRMVQDLILWVVVPILVAQTIRGIRPVGRAIDTRRPTVKVLAQVCVLVIIIKSALLTNAALDDVSMVEGVKREGWSAVELVQVAVVCSGLHTVLLIVGYGAARPIFGHADAMAVAISGSQKTLPVGALVANEFFPHAPLAIVPVLFYHVLQLMIDTYFAEVVGSRHQLPADADAVTS